MAIEQEKRWQQIAKPWIIVVLLLITAAGLWWRGRSFVSLGRKKFDRHLENVMGTTANLTVVLPGGKDDDTREALDRAEAALRAVETAMSRRIESSDIGRLNSAAAGEEVSLSPITRTVLRASREFYNLTRKPGSPHGAFDVTILPLTLRWMRAGSEKALPSDDEIAAARRASSWNLLELTERGAIKKAATASVDLGGIAKGFSIDQATRQLRQAGCAGAMVEVGGDIRCFGTAPSGGKWSIGVRSPFDKRRLLYTIEIASGAVCTSGNYERFSTIQGRRYSHIIDPTTGWPVDFAPSVTVYAPTAMTADVWATALSVLGREGLSLIPKGSRIEAMIILGRPTEYEVVMTPGFRKLLSPTQKP